METVGLVRATAALWLPGTGADETLGPGLALGLAIGP